MIILKKIKNRIEKIKERIRKFLGIRLIKSLRDLIIFKQTIDLQKQHPNPLNSYGKKGFSQTDEDGITLEIIRRIGIKKGIFAEFGPGDGTENNTISLAALGWKGFWVGSENLKFKYNNSNNFYGYDEIETISILEDSGFKPYQYDPSNKELLELNKKNTQKKSNKKCNQ